MSTVANGDVKPTSSSNTSNVNDTTPLLPRKKSKSRRKWPKSVIYRVLLTAFLVSLSFGVTQVPLIYVFGLMTCDEYYKHHPLPPLGTPAYDRRCRIHSIEASTARSVSLLGAGTTFFGVANLFITGWLIKAWGIKKTLMVSTFWPAIRLLVQNLGVMQGAGLGMVIVQLSQVITIIGGPVGYVLTLNSYATEVVLPSERTGILGRLSGCAMFGTALGFLSGGLLTDWYTVLRPFQVTLVLFCLSTTFIFFALPTIPLDPETEKKATKTLGAFFEPLRMFTPRKWRLQNGVVRTEYGVLLLGIGAFLAVFATGYIYTMLQMYSTDVFDFGASDNSRLISLNFAIRAMFLTFAFPAIISTGRKWLDGRNKTDTSPLPIEEPPAAIATIVEAEMEEEEEALLPTEPQQVASMALPAGQANATEPETPLKRTITSTSTIPEETETFAFDLFYARYSLILDGILTALATFTRKGWQVYAVACVIPLAAGTGSAAKGVMLQMCAPEQRNDALSAISLVELVARLSTTSLFGLIFAAFADIGRPNLTFAVNGAVAAVGFVVLVIARFPPDGAVRVSEEEEETGEENA